MSAMNYGQIAPLYDSYVRSNFDVQFFMGEAQKYSGKILEIMAMEFRKLRFVE
jgi:hypothetical protein